MSERKHYYRWQLVAEENEPPYVCMMVHRKPGGPHTRDGTGFLHLQR